MPRQEANLPGYSITSIPRHGPALSGLVGFIARFYVRGGRLLVPVIAAFIVAASVAGGYVAWNGHLFGTISSLADTVIRPESVVNSLPKRDVAPDETKKLLAEADLKVQEVKALAAGTDDTADTLASKRRDIAKELADEGNIREAKNVVASIDGISQELRARKANASPVEHEVKREAAADEERDLSVLERVAEKAEAIQSALPAAEAGMAAVLDDMSSSLEIRIADGKDVNSGFWRTSTEGEEYFIIVGAVTKDGASYEWRVDDADTGKTSRTTRWAVSVTEEEYARLSSEKAISGNLPDTLAGVKRPGTALIEWKIATAGKALAEWSEEQE